MATTKTNKNTLTSQNSAECDALLPKIGAVPEASLLNITTAPRFVVDDGETLFRWANTDRELLIAAGLSPEVIDDLQTGAGALRHIQALWNSWRLSKDQWQKKSREGEALIKKLIHIFLFAYRDNPAALKKSA
jgi:hypothetical protein